MNARALEWKLTPVLLSPLSRGCDLRVGGHTPQSMMSVAPNVEGCVLFLFSNDRLSPAAGAACCKTGRHPCGGNLLLSLKEAAKSWGTYQVSHLVGESAWYVCLLRLEFRSCFPGTKKEASPSIRKINTPVVQQAYELSGPTDGESLLLVHGWPDSPRTWDKVLPLLHKSGYGRSFPTFAGMVRVIFEMASCVGILAEPGSRWRLRRT